MINEYFLSDEIDVFPSAFRTIKKDGKFTSEQNFVNILNSITDINDYVLEYDQTRHFIKSFVIHGYFFRFKNNFYVSDSERYNLWFQIKVEKGANSSNALINIKNDSIELDTGSTIDDLPTSYFQGLKVISSETEPSTDTEADYNIYNLRVTKKGEIVNTVRLKADSIKFNSDSEDTRSVEDELNNKQNKLTANSGSGIVIREETTDDGKVTLIRIDSNYLKTLNSMSDTVGGNNKFVWVDDGEVKPCSDTTNIGSTYSSGTSSAGSYVYTRDTYIKGGTIYNGHGVYASQNPAIDNNVGQNGDIWLRYTN